jgi:effector-binding domain-containing protein
MLDPPQISTIRAQHTATIHLQIPRDSISEVLSTLAAQGVAPEGPMFSYHLRRPSDSFDFEVGFPVAAKINAVGRVAASTLPLTKVARTIYRGPYEGLGDAWSEFNKWVEAEGLNADQTLLESYAVGPETESDPAKWVTELYRPLNG